MKIPLEWMPAQGVFWGVAGVIWCTAAVWRSWRRGVPLRIAFAAVGVVSVAAFVGAGSSGHWIASFGSELGAGDVWALPEVGGFASLGAVAGAGLGLALIASRLREDVFGRLVDALVPAGLVGLGIARAGCLSAGCDFGALTDLPWAVQYPAETTVWSFHHAAGWLEPSASWSRPVHPFPLYCIGVTIVAVTSVGCVSTRPELRAGLAGAVYLLGRTGVEVFRSPEIALSVGGGLNVNQAVAICLLPFLLWRVWIRYRAS